MKKLLLCCVVLATSFSAVLAGGLVTNTNQSAAFLRNPARDATIELDAVYYNPAGVAFLKKGFHFGLNNQSAFQSRNITATLQPNNFVPTALMENKLYEGKIASPVIPSAHFAYVADRWSISSHFGVPGGGLFLHRTDIPLWMAAGGFLQADRQPVGLCGSTPADGQGEVCG